MGGFGTVANGSHVVVLNSHPVKVQLSRNHLPSVVSPRLRRGEGRVPFQVDRLATDGVAGGRSDAVTTAGVHQVLLVLFHFLLRLNSRSLHLPHGGHALAADTLVAGHDSPLLVGGG